MLQKDEKTTILLTGASGFIGKYFLDILKEKYSVIAMSRRSGTEAGVPFHPNVRWVQWDIANKFTYNEVMGYLIGRGGVDIVVHLAGYYDYEYDNNPEYKRTNITGTKNVLELSKHLDVKHFIFASSLAACSFPLNGQIVNEQSPADANFAYARSKKTGEDLCLEYSKYYKCSIVRLAAVYSDWCEYGPLYQFLSTWLSGKWDSRILGGKGESAVTYIHIYDMAHFLLRLIDKTKILPQCGTYIASPNESTSHRNLFYIATRDYYIKAPTPVFIPKSLAYPGIIIKNVLGKMRLVSKPFEKFWMLKYIDRKLEVDASYTYNILSWQPTPRYYINRRLVFLLDKMKSHPHEWHILNEAATKRKTHRPNLIIYEQLVAEQENIEYQIIEIILAEENKDTYSNFQKINPKELKIDISTKYHLILASVRSADRSLMLKYFDNIVLQKYAAGFEPDELKSVLDVFDRIITSVLGSKEELKRMKQDIYDYVSLTIQLAKDVIDDVYENLEQRLPEVELMGLTKKKKKKKLQEDIKKLSTFYQEFLEGEK
ncbi:MAG: NAD(P)-dependent oxidoreductase [Bacteroidetes bacterium]|nr:NAD(P)-dependent oxidoreductase [Bacteroidota bacterium]MBL7103735.1 NAD(P)-dependent oxidoreductase [Bacteroidales bacterium]